MFIHVYPILTIVSMEKMFCSLRSCGQSIGLIKDIPSCQDLMDGMVNALEDHRDVTSTTGFVVSQIDLVEVAEAEDIIRNRLQSKL